MIHYCLLSSMLFRVCSTDQLQQHHLGVEVQNREPHPDLLCQNLHLNNTPGDFYAHHYWRSTALVYSFHPVDIMFESGLNILNGSFPFWEKTLSKMGLDPNGWQRIINYSILSLIYENVSRDQLSVGVILGLLYPHSLDTAFLWPNTHFWKMTEVKSAIWPQKGEKLADPCWPLTLTSLANQMS